jgi:hypothetical protein
MKGSIKMAWQQSIQTAVRELKKEEASLQKQISELQGRIRDLEGLGRSRGGAAVTRRKSGSRRLSAEGRAAISRAAKKRWAKYRRDHAAK